MVCLRNVSVDTLHKGDTEDDDDDDDDINNNNNNNNNRITEGTKLFLWEEGFQLNSVICRFPLGISLPPPSLRPVGE
jgi:hypothetical protein